MDVAFQKLLIEKSLKTADDLTPGTLKDFFIGQAARQQAKLDEFLDKNPEPVREPYKYKITAVKKKRKKNVRSKR